MFNAYHSELGTWSLLQFVFKSLRLILNSRKQPIDQQVKTKLEEKYHKQFVNAIRGSVLANEAMIQMYGKEQAKIKWRTIQSKYQKEYNQMLRDYIEAKVPKQYRFAFVNLMMKQTMDISRNLEGIFEIEYIGDPFQEEFQFNVKRCAFKDVSTAMGK